MMKNKNNFVVAVIAATFGGWSVHSIVESYIAPFLMGMFIVGYYCDILIANKNITNHNVADIQSTSFYMLQRIQLMNNNRSKVTHK
jgi:hypothetical protein